MWKLKMSESLLPILNNESPVSNFLGAYDKGNPSHAVGFLLQLLQFFDRNKTSGQTLDPLLKKYWSWADTNRKRSQIKALIQSLSSQRKNQGF